MPSQSRAPAPYESPGHLTKPSIMPAPRFPILVAASVSAWKPDHSLTLAATPSKPTQAPRSRTQMKLMSRTARSCGLLVATLVACPAAPTPEAVQRFVATNCVDCHDDDIKKGGFDLTALTFDLNDPNSFNRWVQVLDRAQAGEMPPKTEPRPEAAELRAFVNELAGGLQQADGARIATQGRVPARRLTRFEYERTLHDLLGIAVPLVNLLPEDARTDGFDTVSSAQQVSHFLLERYLTAIDAALDEAFLRAVLPAPDYKGEIGWDQFQKFVPRGRDPGPRPEHRDAVSWSSPMPFQGKLQPTRVKERGWYRFTLRVAAVNPPKDGNVWCSVRSGACAANEPLLFWIGSFAVTKEESEHTFEAWVEAGHMIEVRPTDGMLKRLKNREAWDPPLAEKLGTPGVAIKSVAMQQINRGLEPAEIHARLFGALQAKIELGTPKPAENQRRATAGKPAPTVRSVTLASANPPADARQLVRAFATRAFRGPVTEEEAAPYVALAHAELAAGAGLVDALRGAYRAVLSSPRFLYLEEPPGRLTDHALAARLSYFLWSTMPDAELRALADQGGLGDPPRLRGQVERMLREPKARAFIENFTGQWLSLSEIDATTPDDKLYPEFDEVLKHAMVDETRAFFHELVDRDLSVTHVVDASFSLMSNRLARHYGVPWPGGTGMQRVEFRPGDRRGGIITQGSVLKVTANGTTTSPVLRGVWMLERIMGQHVPPVPAGVPAIEPDIRGAKTIREQLDKHRHVASCAVCHVKIDPPGFALESYDVIGSWRDHYRTVKEPKGWQPGPAVDPSFTMADGHAFADMAGFKRILLADPDQLARNLASKFVTYATGAGVSYADRVAVEEIVAKTRKQNHGVRAMIHAVVASPLFQNK
ncbi:MAG: DUF1592 domain-containing protein [Opitutus sp.]|nr:DUF1592 domain-containing protein [Opitutus sp.]